MIDTELVKKAVALMGGFDDKEIETYSQFILAASLSVSELLGRHADEKDARVIQLAAAKAYNSICCICAFFPLMSLLFLTLSVFLRTEIFVSKSCKFI